MSPDATDLPVQDITEVEIPDASPEAVDESVVRTLMGSDRLEQARLGSVVGQQRQIIALLRQQVAAWKAKYEAIAPQDDEDEDEEAEEPVNEDVEQIADILEGRIAPAYTLKSAEDMVGARNGAGG